MSGTRLSRPKKPNYINRFGEKIYMSGFARLMIEVNKGSDNKKKAYPTYTKPYTRAILGSQHG